METTHDSADGRIASADGRIASYSSPLSFEVGAEIRTVGGDEASTAMADIGVMYLSCPRSCAILRDTAFLAGEASADICRHSALAM